MQLSTVYSAATIEETCVMAKWLNVCKQQYSMHVLKGCLMETFNA